MAARGWRSHTKPQRQQVGLRIRAAAMWAALVCVALVAAVAPPKPPPAPMLSLSSGDPLRLDAAWVPEKYDEGEIDAYAIEVAAALAPGALGLSWMPVPPLPAGLRTEVQIVRVRADAGSTIAAGYFQLSLELGTVQLLDTISHSTTPPIAVNASGADVAAALDALWSLHLPVASSSASVVRSVAPDTQGGFSWVVTFDPAAFAAVGAAIPLLSATVVGAASLPGAPWTGLGPQVLVTEARRVTQGDASCGERLPVPAGA